MTDSSQTANSENGVKEELTILNPMVERLLFPSMVSQAAIGKKLEQLKQDTSKDNQKEITLLQDYLKIKSLKPITIPGQEKTYFELENNLGGVSKKIALIDQESTNRKLRQLIDKKPSTLDTYSMHCSNWALRADGMLKLPKHRKNTEVLREYLALQISKLLGLITTDVSMITYQNKPALFIHFQDITPLNAVVHGSPFKPTLFSETYYHYSTLKPVGDGLLPPPNTAIEDFGSSMGLFYLCNDPDAIGGYNQNKAILGRKLFIFDQVLKRDESFALDSRLSIVPIGWKRHSRHFNGRNRTVVEDSSIEAKFDAIMNLKQQTKAIQTCLNDTKTNFQGMDGKLKRELEDDLARLSTIINQRIDKVDVMLPVKRGDLNEQSLKKTLVLEKLLNRPVLYHAEGRAYRYPWTNRHALRVLKITNGVNFFGNLTIEFNGPIPDDLINALSDSGLSSIRKVPNTNSIFINLNELEKITENQLFPEMDSKWQQGFCYIKLSRMQQLAKAYPKKSTGSVLEIVKKHLKDDREQLTLELLTTLEDDIISQVIMDKKKSGFGLHVLKNIQYQKFSLLLEKVDKEDQDFCKTAFSAAHQLDKIASFNSVLECIQKPKLNKFLAKTIRFAQSAHDFKSLQDGVNGFNDFCKSTYSGVRFKYPLQFIAERTSTQILQKLYIGLVAAISKWPLSSGFCLGFLNAIFGGFVHKRDAQFEYELVNIKPSK